MCKEPNYSQIQCISNRILSGHINSRYILDVNIIHGKLHSEYDGGSTSNNFNKQNKLLLSYTMYFKLQNQF